jgi:hypothetical protein
MVHSMLVRYIDHVNNGHGPLHVKNKIHGLEIEVFSMRVSTWKLVIYSTDIHCFF